MKYLAVDIGSSFIKSAILDVDKFEIIKHETIAMFPRISNDNRCFEVDAELIFITVKNIIDHYLAGIDSDISGILFSTQMHGFVLADAQGHPVTQYISWQDERCLDEIPGEGKSYLQYLEALICREDMKESGVYLKAPLALCNLFTLLHQEFTISENTHFCTLGSYIIFRLTGRNVCHITNAAPTGFADIVNKQWNHKVIKKVGCGSLIFPELRNSVDVCAHYQHQNRSIPIYPDIGDQQACVLGCMTQPEEDVNINIGTAAQISVIREQFAGECGELRPFFDGYYLNTISRMPGGRNLDVLIEFIQDVGEKVFNVNMNKSAIWNRIAYLVQNSDTKGLRVDTGFFKTMVSDFGMITNINDVNMRVDTLFLAAFEDFASTYNTYIDKLCTNQNVIKRIVFSGGVSSKNHTLVESISRVTGLKGVLPPTPEEVFIGLFRIALVCSNVCSDIYSTYDKIVYDKEKNLVNVTVI